MKWDGKKPIVITEADENGNAIERIVINPGEELPQEWIDRLQQEGGPIYLSGQDNVFDFEETRRRYLNQKKLN